MGMLILTRRIGESIKINHDIIITTLAVSGNQVRYGIDAPKEIIVHREEIYDRIFHPEKPQKPKKRVLINKEIHNGITR